VPSRPISDALYQSVALDARGECGYCRAPQRALPYRLEVEHLLPTSLGGGDGRDNLWLSCHKCNKLRSNRIAAPDPLTQQVVPLFNPRQNNWKDHFTWEGEGLYVVGRTAIGRATVATLQLNDTYHQSARMVWILAGIYPPKVNSSE
jgi:5-methylcytosine-specific restriction endonuclease McrA